MKPAVFGAVLAAVGVFAAEPSAPPTVVVAAIRGTINPGSASYLRASIAEASRSGAAALIVELDTPGGLVSSVRDMAQAVDGASVPVVVYTAPAGASATSAGALLSLASHVAAMAPGTNIGAAHPVDSQGKDIAGAMGEKVVNDTAAFARGLAELRGRDPQLAAAVVSKSESLTAQEAIRRRLVEIIAADRADLLKQLDGRPVRLGTRAQPVTLRTRDARERAFEMSWGQKLLHFIADPNIATLLISLGMLCIYVELSNPGVTLPGVLGGIMLLVGFMSFQMLPVRLGGVLLIVLGALFFLAEIFVATHGVLSAGGTLAFVLGILWAFDPGSSGLAVSPAVWIPAALGMGSGTFALAWVAARSKRQASDARARIGGGGDAGLAGYTGHVESVDASGKSGKALIRGETWDFVSDAPVVAGDPVRVLSMDGFTARVIAAR